MANPIRLSEVLTDIARLYALLKMNRNKQSVKEFRDRVIDLRNIINNDILETLKIVKSEDVDQWRVMPDAWKVERLMALDEKVALEESVELSDFFFNVSNAVITAQTNLNEFSKKYVEQLKDPRVPPSYFAIPSIKAEMKLGFSELTENGINVVLFKNKEQQSRYVESTVTFELVSVPPQTINPPGSPPPPPPPAPPAPLLSHPHPPLVARHLSTMAAFPAFTASTASETPAEDVAGEEPRGVEFRESIESEAENIPELRRSLEDARATFFAATDRLIESRAILEARAEQEATPDTPIVVGDERAAVLDLIASELETRGEKTAETFAEGREQAVVLKYRAAGSEEADRFLVLWPGGSGGKADEGRELRIYALAVRNGELKLDGSAFKSAPKNKFLEVVAKKQLLRLKKDEMADVAGALGDALMIVATILNQWLEASRRD